MKPGETPPGIAATTRTWSGNKVFSVASGRLRIAEKLDFQRRALPYLQLIFGSSTETPELGRLDRAGIDHVAFDDAGGMTVCVQSKGFAVMEADIGTNQAEQCIKSIDQFKRSGHRTDVYLVLHNRDHRNPRFNSTIIQSLSALVSEGSAAWAGLWDRRDLLSHACESAYQHVRIAASAMTTDMSAQELALAEGITVEEVPCRRSTVRLRPAGSPRLTDWVETLVDPVTVLENSTEPLRLLLGEFGYGKTTAAARAAEKSGNRMLLLPGARLPVDMVSSRQILAAALVHDLQVGPLDVSTPELRPLFELGSEQLLGSPDAGVTLVVDGLDESPLAARRGGAGDFFNALQYVRVPVVITGSTRPTGEHGL